MAKPILIIHIKAFVTVMCVLQERVTTSNQYIKQCHSWNGPKTFHMDCSKRNLTSIPVCPANVTNLDLHDNIITFVPKRFFENLKHLKDLDFSYNQLTLLDSESFYGLRHLQRLNLEGNQIFYIFVETGFLEPLKSLRYLNIKFNSDISFPDDKISNLTKLEYLEIDTHSYSGGYAFGDGFSLLTNLRTLILGNCIIPNFNNYTLSNVPLLEYIDISNCHIRNYDACALCQMQNVVHLDLPHSSLNFSSIIHLMTDLNQTSSIRSLYIDSLFFDLSAFPLKVFTFLYFTPIRTLSVRRNGFYDVSDYPFQYSIVPPTLQNLDFSNNKLVKFSFQIPYLLTLNLENNSLGKFLAKNNYLRSNETKLRYINLASNALYKLIFTLFHGHYKLESINLSHNSLDDLTFDLSHATNLQLIDLSSNEIKSFSETARRNIDQVIKTSNTTIDVSGNILDCSCEGMSFLRWMFNNIGHFRYLNTYKCKLKSGAIVMLDNFQQTLQNIEHKCSSNSILIMCVSFGVVIILTSVSACLIYKYRWKLRYLYYMAKRSRMKQKLLENDEEYTYDAFLSYSDNDRKFVVKECIPNLDHNTDIKLCIHHRDFLPGEEITSNITDAIHESRKTVCVISKSFLESYYCMFEFNMARMESIYSRNGRNIVFLILYENVSSHQLPLEMLEHVQKHSYIEYSDDEQGNIVFWDKFKEAITQ